MSDRDDSPPEHPGAAGTVDGSTSGLPILFDLHGSVLPEADKDAWEVGARWDFGSLWWPKSGSTEAAP